MQDPATEVLAPSLSFECRIAEFSEPAEALVKSHQEALEYYLFAGVIPGKAQYFLQPREIQEPTESFLEAIKSHEIALNDDEFAIVRHYRTVALDALKALAKQPDIDKYIKNEALFQFTDTSIRDGAMGTTFNRLQTGSGPSQMSMIVSERLRDFIFLRQALYVLSLDTFKENSDSMHHIKLIGLLGLQRIIQLVPKISIPLSEDYRRSYSYL